MKKVTNFFWGSKRRKVVTILVIVLGGMWVNGTFDYALANVGLNFHECGKNGFGATFCGDDLTRYNEQFSPYEDESKHTVYSK